MPGRQYTRGAHPNPGNASKSRSKKAKSRSLDAFAIAGKQFPEQTKTRRTRLGQVEDNGPRRRARDDQDDEENEDADIRATKRARKGGKNDLDSDRGSDSEGNEWLMGQVASDDDESIDSDEAMDESDEEKFEGFAFRGSSSTSKTKGKRSREVMAEDGVGIDLNEEDGTDEEGSGAESDESLGDDAVDLADMLDATEEAEGRSNGRASVSEEEGNGSGTDGEGSMEEFDEEESELSASEDEVDPSKLSALQTLITSMHADTAATDRRRSRPEDPHESNEPSEFGVSAQQKLTLSDLLPSVTDPRLKKSLKLLSDSKPSNKRQGIPGKLQAPLPKRQQDKLDRAAAFEKSKETLNRWIDTVKHNRRAEHLSFPLVDPDASAVQGTTRLVPTDTEKPMTDLESTIQTILQESGLAPEPGKSTEDKLQEFEELESKKISLEEIQARRAELRRARELLFREEIRAKRIKKIKSRSYRRVHRKQREKEQQAEREALAAAGVELSDEEQEKIDRRRAEERMGQRHRESRWAKAVKDTGRGAWDEDARTGVTEMARRGEELRRSIEGKTVRDGESESDLETDESSENEYGSDEDEVERLQRSLNSANGEAGLEMTGPGSKLFSMKFMQKAEASRKMENDGEVERLRRELADEDTPSEAEGATVGRRKMGPRENKPGRGAAKVMRNEFEEGPGSDNEDGQEQETAADGEVDFILTSEHNAKAARPLKTSISDRRQPVKKSGLADADNDAENPWLAAPPKSSNKKRNAPITEPLFISTAMETPAAEAVTTHKGRNAPQSNVMSAATFTKGRQSNGGVDSDEESSEGEGNVPIIMRNQDLVRKAFAGDEVVADFAKEKREAIEEDEEKIIDNTLPGWGSWTGSGISKREKARNKGRILVKQEGIKEASRKDAKLDRVIINEKRVKKNGKYLASALPHPYESRQQYERALRLPVGPEWTTKETFQNATKPRVLLKHGVIAPMDRPLL